MSRIVIAFLILSLTALAQMPDKNSSSLKKKINSEIFYFKADSTFTVFYLYKIPYSSLVFEKSDSKFISKIEVILEIKNSKEQVVHRKFKKEIIEQEDYISTVSENKFLYDFFEFELGPDSFLCNVNYNDLITNRSITNKNNKIDLINTKDTLKWLLLKPNNKKEKSFGIEVFGNIIPHSSINYDLMIPLSKDFPTIDKISIKIKDSTVTDLDFERLESVAPKIYSVKDYLKLELEDKNCKDLLLIKNINEKLFEANYQLQFIFHNSNKQTEIPLSVIWVDKPASLSEYDFALELIEVIEPEVKYRTYFTSESEKRNKLLKYWITKDPSPNTSFNELMNEFYLRVDFAQKEFISISQKNGAKTDRGKIYILNGKPEKTERNVNTEGKVVEIWYYKSPDRTYTFIDYKGDGTFKLVQ